MPEYIDREKSIHYLEDYYNKMNGMNPWYYTGFKNAVGLLEHVEKSDVAPVVHGEWMRYRNTLWHYCSNCLEDALMSKSTGTEVLSDLCPHCGAKMDLEDDE